MTVVSVKGTPADPAVPPIATGAVADDPATAGDFLAAMLAALGSSADGSEAQPADPNTSDDPDTPAAALDASALALVATPPPLPGLVAPPSGGAGRAPAPGHANVAEAAAVTPTSTGGDIRMSVHEAGAPPSAAGDTGDPGTVAASPTAPAAQTTDLPAPGPASRSTDDAAESAEPRTPAPADPSTGTNDPVAAPGVSSSATGSSSSPVTAPAVPATPSPHDVTPAQHVTRQVIPEVTGLVSRGEGTHRITLALKPEALGEVRVVMTVRDGSVHVRLAAGQEAQRALLEGSHELTRLLDAAGVSDTRVTVRDLSTGAPATSTAGESRGGNLGAGGNAAQDQHAGTRAQHPATDGTHDGSRHRRAAAGANPPRSNEPVTHTRTAGVDVTM